MADGYDGFQWYDWLIFAVTLAISMSIGIYYALTGGKQKTTREYLLANRSMGTFPVALSIYVSHISGTVKHDFLTFSRISPRDPKIPAKLLYEYMFMFIRSMSNIKY